ncbi:MAG: ComF family protein [Clostridia bacterium]|nr:ComF family protein [Clostridia bacterium]
MNFQGFGERILKFFMPDQCALCGECGWSPLCPDCREDLRRDFSPWRFLCYGGNGFADRMLALFPYESIPARVLIFRWKRENYDDIHRCARWLVNRSVKNRLFYKGIDLVTFAPRRPSARRRAGFDQGEELAEIVAEAIGRPCVSLLERRGLGKAQHRLSVAARKKNVQGAFSATSRLAGETVLLVDDVVTTGASVRECARILKGAGAQKVYVLCLAHPRPRKAGNKHETFKKN